jgi:uncharacterized membrane protein
MTDLGSAGGDPCSRALSINSEGQIVGASAAVCGGPLTRALLFENGGPAIDLNTQVDHGSGLALTEAIYINDRGEIAGIGALSNGNTHAFLLIPCEAGDEGCVDSVEAATTATQNNPAPVNQTSTMVTHDTLTQEMLPALRARFARRNHIPGLGVPRE